MLTKTVPTRSHLLNKSILLTTLALLLVSVVRPLTATADDNVAVFDFSDDTFITNNGLENGTNLPSTLTVDGVTLTFKKVGNLSPGYNTNPGRASLYTKNTLTVTSSDKPIKSIEFTAYSDGGNAKYPSASNFTATLGTLDYGTTTCTWSGEATAVTFKNIASGSTRICLQCIKVYTEEQTSSKSTPDLKFSSESATATVNGSVNVTLNNVPDGATVSYASSATNIATVSADGVITPIAPGVVTITASTSSTDSYLQGVAECSLTVTPSTETTQAIQNLYAKVTSEDDIVEDGIYLVVYEGDAASYAMGTYKSSKTKRDPVAITIDEDKHITTAVNQDSKPYEVTLVSTGTTSNNNVYYLKFSNGNYLYNESTTGNTSEKDYSKLASKYRPYLYWTITYNTDGTVSITNNKYAVPTNLLYNTSSSFFSAYKPTSEGAKSITLYRRTGSVTINTTEGYATLYTDCAFIMPEGLQGTTITGINSDNSTLATQWEYEPGDVVPAYTGVLIKGTYGTTYTYNFVNTTLENSENCLAGTLVNDTPTDDGSNFYRLTYSSVNDVKTLGFYLWNTDGKPGENAAGHAYLKLPKAATSAVKGFALIDPEATAIRRIETSTARPQTIYTLSGLRLNATSTDALPAGVYIVGGKKVLMR